MSNLTNQIERLYALFVRMTNSLQSPLLLLIRVYWGWQISQNGWGKASQPLARHRIFSEPRPPRARLHRHLRLQFRIHRRHPARPRPTFAHRRPRHLHRHDHRLPHRRPRIVPVLFLRPRQIRRRRPLHLLVRRPNRPDFRSRKIRARTLIARSKSQRRKPRRVVPDHARLIARLKFVRARLQLERGLSMLTRITQLDEDLWPAIFAMAASMRMNDRRWSPAWLARSFYSSPPALILRTP